MKKVTFIRRPVQVAQPKIGFFGRIFGFAKRKVAVAALILVMLGGSATAFAYWASGVNVTNPTDETETVTIGTGDTIDSTVTLTETVSSTDVLVPTTITPGSGEVNSVVFTYTVDWTEDNSGSFGDGTLGTLEVDVSNILVGGVADQYDLVNVVITPGDESQAVVLNDAGTYTVTVTVTLKEPANQTEYAAVAGLDITFNVSFTVTVDPN